MKRRSFIQSLTAAMGAAVAPFSFDCELALRYYPPIRYDLFCCGWDMARYDLKTPWSPDRNGLIATDGRVVIKVDDPHDAMRYGGIEDRKVPSLHHLEWDEFTKSDGWSPLSFVRAKGAEFADYPCPQCFGRNRVGESVRLVDCPCIVDGISTGAEYCTRCDNEYEIWVGGAECGACHRGMVDYAYGVGERRFCPGYIGKIQTLGDVEVKLITVCEPQAYPDRDGHGLAFRFRGRAGIGFLMGLAW